MGGVEGLKTALAACQAHEDCLASITFPGRRQLFLPTTTITNLLTDLLFSTLMLTGAEDKALQGCKCAGINRHVVEDERALQERSSDSILTSSLALFAVARRSAKRRQRH